MTKKKIDKEFCLTDNSVNCYGYRLLTEGLKLERFNPPIGFLMHEREKGVAVRWEDFRKAGDKLYAKPVVNISQFPDLAEQIEGGFYTAASVGKIVALEIDNSPKLKMDGQTGGTVTKWFPRECSIVDIPGNYNALAKLYDESNQILKDLSAAFVTQNKKPENLLSKVRRKYAGKTVNQLWLSGELEHIKNFHPDYFQELTGKLGILKQNDLQDKLVEENIPERYIGKTYQKLFISGELEYIKKHYPNYYQKLLKSK